MAPPPWAQKGAMALPGMVPQKPMGSMQSAPTQAPSQTSEQHVPAWLSKQQQGHQGGAAPVRVLPWGPPSKTVHEEVLPSGARKTIERRTDVTKDTKDGVEVTRTKHETTMRITGPENKENEPKFQHLPMFGVPKIEPEGKKNVWQPTYVPPLPVRVPEVTAPVEGEYIPDPTIPVTEHIAPDEEADKPLPEEIAKKLKPAEDEPLSPTHKKAYGSSAFFEPGIEETAYPTIEEQVNMCKKVAQTLTSPLNMNSRGSKMFFKRQKKAAKWTHSNVLDEPGDQESSEADTPTSPKNVKLTPEGVPKFLLKPSAFDEMKETEHIELSDHSHVQPQKCFDLAETLKTATTGKGAKMFKKRVERSEKWVVDESKIPKKPEAGPVPETKLKDLVGLEDVHLETVEGQHVEYGESFNVAAKGWQPSGESKENETSVPLASQEMSQQDSQPAHQLYQQQQPQHTYHQQPQTQSPLQQQQSQQQPRQQLSPQQQQQQQQLAPQRQEPQTAPWQQPGQPAPPGPAQQQSRLPWMKQQQPPQSASGNIPWRQQSQPHPSQSTAAAPWQRPQQPVQVMYTTPMPPQLPSADGTLSASEPEKTVQPSATPQLASGSVPSAEQSTPARPAWMGGRNTASQSQQGGVPWRPGGNVSATPGRTATWPPKQPA